MEKQEATLTFQQADAALENVESRRAQFSAALAKVGSELAEAEARMGEDVLDGNQAAVQKVSDFRLEVDGLSAALTALERRRATAQGARRKAEALDLRRRAAEKKAALAELEKKTAKLLAALGVLEGIEFDPCILGAQRAGAWVHRLTGAAARPWEGPNQVGSDPLNAKPYFVPRSRQLRDEAAELEAQAGAIEREFQAPAEPVGTAPEPAHTPAAV